MWKSFDIWTITTVVVGCRIDFLGMSKSFDFFDISYRACFVCIRIFVVSCFGTGPESGRFSFAWLASSSLLGFHFVPFLVCFSLLGSIAVSTHLPRCTALHDTSPPIFRPVFSRFRVRVLGRVLDQVHFVCLVRIFVASCVSFRSVSCFVFVMFW